jgi:hypothetical protein
MRARLEVKEGPHQSLDLAAFGPASLEFTRLRGVDTSPDYLLNGRQMFSVGFGMWSGPEASQPVSGAPPSLVGSFVSAGRLAATMEYLKFVREDLAIGAAVHVMVDSVESTSSGDTLAVRDRVGLNIPFVVRWNPIRPLTSWHAVEPYVRGAFGPLLAAHNTIRSTGAATLTETVMNTTIGGSLGGGADIRLGRSWTAGIAGSYLFSGDVKEVGVDSARYSGWEVTFGIGYVFGANKAVRR